MANCPRSQNLSRTPNHSPDLLISCGSLLVGQTYFRGGYRQRGQRRCQTMSRVCLRIVYGAGNQEQSREPGTGSRETGSEWDPGTENRKPGNRDRDPGSGTGSRTPDPDP